MATPDPHPRPGGDPRENTRALQRLIDAPGRTVVRFDAGQYEFAGPVTVPADKVLVLDGGGVAQLFRTGYRELIVLTPADNWHGGRFTLRDFWAVSGRVVTADAPVQLAYPVIERCEFHSPDGYAIDCATGYCVSPRVAGCRFHGGGLRWTYHRRAEEPHSSSVMVVEGCRFDSSPERRTGPDILLRGAQMVAVRDCICEGYAGFRPGVDPAEYHHTVGVLIDAPGPRGGQVGPVWCEYGGYPPGDWCDVRIHNPYAGPAGAYESRGFVLDNVTANGRVVMSAHPEAYNVATVESRGGTMPTAEGPVVVRRWLTEELQDRARRAKSPVWDYR